MDCIYIAPLSKALYNLCLSFTHSHKHSHTHSHTNGDLLLCKVPTSSSGAIGGHFDTPRVGSNRQAFRLPDDSPYLRSYIAPMDVDVRLSTEDSHGRWIFKNADWERFMETSDLYISSVNKTKDVERNEIELRQYLYGCNTKKFRKIRKKSGSVVGC